MQAWNWGAQAPQAAASFASPQAFPGQVAQVYQSGQVAQTYTGGQIPQGFPAASALVPGQQMMTNYQQFYGGAMPATTTEVPAGYTPQQWEAAQQQHFLQWQQWNQQYQQWQQEYGNTYSMAVQGGQSALPPSSTAEPPPLPPPDKPPPPPEESRGEQPNFQMPPPDISPNFKGQKRPTEDDQSKYQGPADKKQRGDNLQQFGRDGAVNTWGSTSNEDTAHNEEEDRSEQERVFDSQFLNWEGEFLSWKEQNINHPDKNQYNEYEKKWTKWRQELLHRREQMRKKRLASMAKGSPDAAASKARPKGDRPAFPDNKPIRNLGGEFHDSGKDSVPGLHPEGFGFRAGQPNQQAVNQMGPSPFPANGKAEIKSLLDLPLQFTGQYAKKGYASAEKDADVSKPTEAPGFVEPQKPQVPQQGDQTKNFQKTWAPNFQGPLQPKINFNFNKSGNNQFENANGSSQPTYGPHSQPGGPLGATQIMASDPNPAKMGQNLHGNQDFSKDIQIDNIKPLLPKSELSSALESKCGEVIDITEDKEVAPNYDFLKKSNVIPGLDLFGDKSGDAHKKVPTNENKSGQAPFGQDSHFDSRIQTSQGQGFEFLKGSGTGGQLGPNKAPGQGLLPPPGFGGSPSVNPWPGHSDAQKGFGVNRGQGFQGNMPAFGLFGQAGSHPPYGQPGSGPGNQPPYGQPGSGPGNQPPYGQPGSGPGNQPPYFGPGSQNQNPGNANEGPGIHKQNFSQGNQGPYMSPQNNGPHLGSGNPNPNFSSPGNMGPTFTSPGNKGQNSGPGNLNQNMVPNYNTVVNKNQDMGPGNQNQNFGPGNMGPSYPGGPGGNQGQSVGSGANQGFGPGNVGQNFSPNMKGPSMIPPLMPPSFGPGGPMNMGPSNQSSTFGPANSAQGNAGQNFGPGNQQQQQNASSGNQASNFNPMDQMNRNNQGFGGPNFGPKSADLSGFIRDQPPPRSYQENQNFPGGQFGSGTRNWGENQNQNQEARNQGAPDKPNIQGPNTWGDNADNAPWNQGGSGRNPQQQQQQQQQHSGPLRDANQGPRDNFAPDNVGHPHRPGDQFSGGPMNKFPPKDGFADGIKSTPMIDSFPGGKEQFPKSFPQVAREDFPGQDKFGGPRDSFPKDGPNIPPNRENYSKEGPGFPGPREGFPKDAGFPNDRPLGAPGMRDRAVGGDPKFADPRDSFPKEAADFRGPRDRFGDDRGGLVDPPGPPREGGFPDRFPREAQDDFPRDRFIGRDRFGPGDVPRSGYPERDHFREDFRGREAAFHERSRSMEFGERGNTFFPRDHEFEHGRMGERGGWDQRGGPRPPHDFYRPRQFDDRPVDPYSQWGHAPQRPPGWDSVMEPVTIVEYGHKTAPATPGSAEQLAAAKLLKNVQTFDYAHGATPRNARDTGPPPASEPWRRDEMFGRDQDRDRRNHEREGRWERDRDRGRRDDEEDRFRSRPEDRWGRHSDRDNDRRPRDSKRDGDSGRGSKGGPPPAPPPPPSFSNSSESGKGGGTSSAPSGPTPPNQRPILVEDLLSAPGRDSRPQRIVVILRGPPGSGKTFVAKLIKDKEVEMGGPPPRILCLDDYFMVEMEKEEKDTESGRKIKVKVMEYEYEAGMEKDYRCSLVKAFKKTVNENYFPFVIVDCVNQQVKNFEEMWSFAKQKGFQVYICEMDMDVGSCSKRNTHNRSEKEIAAIVKGWEETPKYYLRLDVRSLLQSVAITEVEMEDSTPDEEQDKTEEKEEEADEDNSACVSKWERMEPSGDKLDRLDGLRRLKSDDKPKTLEDWLQLSDDYDKRETKPGQKRVRWADLEEKREQEKMRAIGFVVGQTDWSRMTDPTRGESALTQTKYI